MTIADAYQNGLSSAPFLQQSSNDAERFHYAKRTLEVVRKTSGYLGEDYFLHLVVTLCECVGARYALVAEHMPGTHELQTVAFAQDGRALDNFRYSADGTPCEEVLDHGPQSYSAAVSTLFPDDADLVTLGVECYVGVPLVGAGGESIGVLTVMHDQRFDEPVHVESILEVAAARTSAELLRVSAEREAHRAARLESLGLVAGGLIHDYNNLFTAIVGNAELARFHPNDPLRVANHLDQIVKAAETAQEFAEPLRAAAGRGQGRRKPSALGPLARDVVDVVAGQLLAADVEAIFEIDEDPDLLVDVDSGQFKQLVMNLVLNGRDALEERPVREIRVRVSLVSTSRPIPRGYGGSPLGRGSYVCLSVQDTGAGMSPATAMRLFDPFYTTKDRGKGLGLAVVLGVVKSHNAAIEVDTVPERGTAFHVYFPLSSRPTQPLDRQAATQSSQTGQEPVPQSSQYSPSGQSASLRQPASPQARHVKGFTHS